MKSLILTTAIALAISSTAEAKSKKHLDSNGNAIVVSDPRPAAWCGWGLKRYLGLTDKRLNKASNWAVLFGSRANGPSAGVIVVWPHHVGRIVEVTKPGFAIVHSFNDGHAERTRERSLRGVIAYRYPSGSQVAVASDYETTSGALR